MICAHQIYIVQVQVMENVRQTAKFVQKNDKLSAISSAIDPIRVTVRSWTWTWRKACWAGLPLWNTQCCFMPPFAQQQRLMHSDTRNIKNNWICFWFTESGRTKASSKTPVRECSVFDCMFYITPHQRKFGSLPKLYATRRGLLYVRLSLQSRSVTLRWPSCLTEC